MAEFTTQPSYSYIEDIGFRTKIISMEDGGEVRNSYGTPRRIFTLVYDRITQAKRDTIVNFFSARFGEFDSFSWLNPNDNITYTVRFVGGTLEVTEIEHQFYNIKFQFAEVI